MSEMTENSENTNRRGSNASWSRSAASSWRCAVRTIALIQWCAVEQRRTHALRKALTWREQLENIAPGRATRGGEQLEVKGGSEEKSMEASLRLLPAAWAALLSLPACPRADLGEQTADWLESRMRKFARRFGGKGWHYGSHLSSSSRMAGRQGLPCRGSGDRARLAVICPDFVLWLIAGGRQPVCVIVSRFPLVC